MNTFRQVRTLVVAMLALIMTVAGAVAQELPKIAVYVTGDVSDNEKKALGTRILVSLVNSGRYKGIERSNSFLAEIAKEQVKQRSGDIDDDQISTLGKQFGVKFVCIADITPAFGEFQVSARIVNVETAEVEFIGDASGPLNSMTDLERISNLVVNNMFSKWVSNITEPKPMPKPEPKLEPEAVPTPAQTANVQQSAVATPSKTTFVDSRDGKTYKKVTIGTQTWMAENLNYNARGSKSYKNKSDNGNKYGRLYNWSQALSVCPAGWHLPSDAEWTRLTDYVGGSKVAGKMLKSTHGWNNSGNGTNEYRFSALPGGNGNSSGDFDNAGHYGYWWCATGNGADNALHRHMYYNSGYIYRSNNDKLDLYSVRCVEN